MGWSSAKGWNSQGWSRPAAAGGGGVTSTFVVFTNIELNGFDYPSTAIDMTGAAAGDLLVIDLTVFRTSDDPLTATGLPTLNGSGGSLIKVSRDIWATNSGVQVAQSYLLYKALTSADIADGTMNVPSYGGFETFAYNASIWHGGTTVAKKDFATSASGAATTLALAGYAQSAGTAAVLGLIVDNQIGGTTAPPSPFVDKQNNQGIGYGVTNNGAAYISRASSNLSAITYTFTGFASDTPADPSHKGQAGYLIEIG